MTQCHEVHPLARCREQFAVDSKLSNYPDGILPYDTIQFRRVARIHTYILP